jgi:hypothetical protein
LVVVEQALLD